ncbi:MAG: hypothetical protein JST78_07995 [Bacteroidetes bacterium]|nr:hypothetical protein [Bacteroidota bacterium]
MKYLIFLLLVSLNINSQTTNPKYDEALAKKVGADDFGMKHYIFVVLKSGTNQSKDQKFKDSCFAGHLQNIKKLADARKLVVAGPFGKNDSDFRGLFILNVSTIEEAKQLLQTDPAIKEDFLKPEMYLWYGSAALSEYLDASEKVWKKGF